MQSLDLQSLGMHIVGNAVFIEPLTGYAGDEARVQNMKTFPWWPLEPGSGPQDKMDTAMYIYIYIYI